MSSAKKKSIREARLEKIEAILEAHEKSMWFSVFLVVFNLFHAHLICFYEVLVQNVTKIFFVLFTACCRSTFFCGANFMIYL